MPAILLSDLQRVQSALHQHRRQPGRRRIPDNIRRQAVDLLTSHTRRQVVTGLGISYLMLSHWEQEVSCTETTPDPETIRFVRLPAEAEPDCPVSRAESAIELRLSAEVAITFSGTGATTDCLWLLQGLGYGRPRVSA